MAENCTSGTTSSVACMMVFAIKIIGRTTRHKGYAASQKFRKRIEEVFGWLKTVGLFRKTRYQGVKKNRLALHLGGNSLQLGPNEKPENLCHITQGKSSKKRKSWSASGPNSFKEQQKQQVQLKQMKLISPKKTQDENRWPKSESFSKT